DVAALSQAAGADAPREGSFDPRPLLVEGRKLGRLLALAGCLEGVREVLAPQGEGAPSRAPRRAETPWPAGTRGAVSVGELDLDHLRLAVVDGRGPTVTRASRRTGHLLPLPIDGEILGRKALVGPSLPVVVPPGRPDQVNTVVLATVEEELGVQVA